MSEVLPSGIVSRARRNAGSASSGSRGEGVGERLVWADTRGRVAAAITDRRFLAVTAQGRLTGPEVHVLVSTRDFGAGYRIIQAFETQGHTLLIDRGFIRLTDKDAPRPPHEITVTGNLYWPDETDSYTPENDLGANIWYARDVAPLAAFLGTEPAMIIARHTTPADPRIAPLPIDTGGIPNRHLEYVFTWYGLALTWVIMSLYFLRRRSMARKQDESES